ncbi:MAG: DUF2852 domain-containing protein [Gemmobacter sp.]|jgi:hypothetical protein|nr:DUF2852 domain-containing protein [Gemmobacter sp.]
MYTAPHAAPSAPRTSGPLYWLRQAEDWLDQRGRGAWIVAMVLGFVFVWPLGLAILFYALISGKFRNSEKGHTMFCCRRRTDHPTSGLRRWGYRGSGNAAFDSYKADMLKHLEEEQEAFESFLDRLRQAKDRREFESFMEERARKAAATPEPEAPAAGSF